MFKADDTAARSLKCSSYLLFCSRQLTATKRCKVPQSSPVLRTKVGIWTMSSSLGLSRLGPCDFANKLQLNHRSCSKQGKDHAWFEGPEKFSKDSIWSGCWKDVRRWQGRRNRVSEQVTGQGSAGFVARVYGSWLSRLGPYCQELWMLSLLRGRSQWKFMNRRVAWCEVCFRMLHEAPCRAWVCKLKYLEVPKRPSLWMRQCPPK